LDQRLQEVYLDITRQSQFFTAFSGIAIFIACLGLVGLAAFTAEQRTKEIGIRKAMGARTGDILGLLLWQFTKPVLWANVIAWPAAYFIMRRWLEGFAYHIDLSPWMFLAASATALAIAVLTVIGHALLVARAQPVTALRYE
jgi:putative ABC transport system permease protein